jgi:hypothetical protein
MQRPATWIKRSSSPVINPSHPGANIGRAVDLDADEERDVNLLLKNLLLLALLLLARLELREEKGSTRRGGRNIVRCWSVSGCW